jgi:predicted GIY-YIG superfamily endonuclease
LLLAYYVHLLVSDKYGTLYLGMTNDVVHRGAIGKSE